MENEPKYKRLTRARPRTRFAVISHGNSSLWLGPDHLLGIDSSGYSENYKRFYFRDIQAFIIQTTDTYKYVSLVLGFLGLFLGIFAAITSDTVGRIILFLCAGLFCFFMLLNLLFGPTTQCYIQTAVQIESLPSLRRLRKARKVLNVIRPLLVSAQGELAAEEIARRFGGTPAQAVQQPSVTEAPPVIDQVLPAAPTSVDAPNVPPHIQS